MASTETLQDEKKESNMESDREVGDESLLTISPPSLPSDTNLTSSIVTHLPDGIITPLSSTGNIDNTDNLSSNGSLIITNEGIVWAPGGTLMLSRQEVDNLPSTSNISDNLENNGNEATEFDIKVNSPTSLPSSYKVENSVSEANDAGETNFSINQSVLQSRQINFSSGENMAQFQVQLSMSDLHNLQKITNENVLMSQAALPEDSSSKHAFLTSISPTLDTEGDSKNVDVENDEAKQFLSSDPSFSSEDHNNLFIKNEVGGVSQDDRDEDSTSTLIKSEITQKQPVEKSTEKSISSSVPTSVPSIVYVQVQSNGQSQIVALAPQSVQNATASIQQSVTDVNKETESCEDEASKKKRRKRAKTPKLVAIASKEPEGGEKAVGQRTLAPRLLSYPLYAGAQASLGIGKTLLKPYNYGTNTVPLLETGQYFEVLGRCTLCFRFSRTTSYCRSEKNHREPKASACAECEAAGQSTVVCRRKLNHTAPNAQPLNIVINTALQSLDHVKQLCVRHYLPACFAELQSIVVHHADITFVAQRKSEEDLEFDNLGQPVINTMLVYRQPTDYARGYFYPYDKEKWEQWLQKFCHQTGTDYRIRTGKRVNKKTDHHGLANHNGKIVWYRTLETQLYNCALGGKPRKRKQVEGVRKRKERGSKLIGCSAVIHTRLIETKAGWKALEVTVPKILAHLPFHDPRLTAPQTLADYHEVLVTQINPALQLSGITTQPPAENFDFVSVVADSPNLTNQQSKETTPLEIRKNTKHLLLTCASLVDTVESPDVMAAVQVQAQELLNNLLQESSVRRSPKKKRKKPLESNSMMNDDIIDIDAI